MPEMDGLEATKAIRKMDRADAGKIPIIAQTANAFDEDVQRSMQAGLNAHLSKPVEPDTLFETLAKADYRILTAEDSAGLPAFRREDTAGLLIPGLWKILCLTNAFFSLY